MFSKLKLLWNFKFLKKKKNLFRHHVPKLPYFIQHSDLVTSSVKLKGEFKKKNYATC